MRKRKNVSIKRLSLTLLLVGFLIVTGLQTALLMTYHHGKVTVGSFGSVLLRDETIKTYLESLSEPVVIKQGQKTLTRDSAVLGRRVNVAESLRELQRRSASKSRFVPIAGLYQLLSTTKIPIVYSIDSTTLETQSKKIAAELTYKPQDAKFTYTDGKLTIIPEVAGGTVDPTQIITALSTEKALGDQPVEVAVKPIAAAVTIDQLAPVADMYKAVQATDLTVHIDGMVFKLTKDQVAGLITVDPSAGTQAITVNNQAIAEIVAEWSKDVSITPGVTQVDYRDDVEVSRVEGKVGRSLDTEIVATKINDWFKKPTADALEFTTDIVYPRVSNTYTYSHSSAQLQAQLDAWVAKTPGSYRIAVRELGGRGREASVNADSPTVMASTYKIFLAFVAYRMAENNELSLDTVLLGSKTISQCIEPMIVDSDNDCAVALGKKIGWVYAEQVIKDAGFVGVKMNNYDADGVLVDDKMVSGEQEARFLMQLSAGTLMSQDHTNDLLGLMKRQVYRDGIPAGSNGSVVADKVGFLFGYYYHDVGIVYGENSTYALVIMTEDAGGWDHIREAAQAVYDFMNAPE